MLAIYYKSVTRVEPLHAATTAGANRWHLTLLSVIVNQDSTEISASMRLTPASAILVEMAAVAQL